MVGGATSSRLARAYGSAALLVVAGVLALIALEG